MRDIEKLSPDELDKPLLTSEYLELRVAETNDRKNTVIRISIIFAICQTIAATGVLADALFSQKAALLELNNQKQIAVLSAKKNEAVATNEIRVCQSLRDVILHQRQVATILAEDAEFFVSSPLRRLAVKKLSDEINAGRLPACDGFPSSPIPQN